LPCAWIGPAAAANALDSLCTGSTLEPGTQQLLRVRSPRLSSASRSGFEAGPSEPQPNPGATPKQPTRAAAGGPRPQAAGNTPAQRTPRPSALHFSSNKNTTSNEYSGLGGQRKASTAVSRSGDKCRKASRAGRRQGKSAPTSGTRASAASSPLPLESACSRINVDRRRDSTSCAPHGKSACSGLLPVNPSPRTLQPCSSSPRSRARL